MLLIYPTHRIVPRLQRTCYFAHQTGESRRWSDGERSDAVIINCLVIEIFPRSSFGRSSMREVGGWLLWFCSHFGHECVGTWENGRDRRSQFHLPKKFIAHKKTPPWIWEGHEIQHVSNHRRRMSITNHRSELPVKKRTGMQAIGLRHRCLGIYRQ